jgi:hypothetical protein
MSYNNHAAGKPYFDDEYPSDEQLMEWAAEYCEETEQPIYAKVIRKREAERDENKRGWDRASLAALDLEQRLKRAEKCILAIEQHYREKSPLTYSASTLANLINEWRKIN